MSRIIAGVAAILAFVLLCAATTILIVDQRTDALTFTWGETQPRVIVSPGLHFKWPPPVTKVVRLDKRIQTLTRHDALRVRDVDQADIAIRWGIQWRITDPRLYFSHFENDFKSAQSRLSERVDTAVRAFVAQRAAAQLIAESHLMGRSIRPHIAADARTLGIDIVDVRVVTLDFHVSGADSVSLRMETQYKQAAQQLRLAGMLESADIRATAEGEREERLAQAYQQAQTLKGEGDAQAAAIYADAYGRDPQFYRFYQSLQAYRKSFGARDVIIVDPSSYFFRFMRRPDGADR